MAAPTPTKVQWPDPVTTDVHVVDRATLAKVQWPRSFDGHGGGERGLDGDSLDWARSGFFTFLNRLTAPTSVNGLTEVDKATASVGLR